MTLQEVIPYVIKGHWGLLPNYNGYFKWDFLNKCIYMLNGDYIKYDLTDEKLRTDFYYII